MFDSHTFYKKRLSSHVKNLSRYLKYMFNGHIAFAMLFFTAATAYYYQQWLEQLPANFPTGIIMGIVLGLLISYNPIRTLLQEPDLVFLIAAEQRMGPYFRNSIMYSFVIQTYLIVLAAAAFGPLYFTSFSGRAGSVYLVTILLFLVLKGMNMLTNWNMLKVRDKSLRTIDLTARTLLNIVTAYFVIEGHALFAIITIVLLLLVIVYDFMVAAKQPGIIWDLLIEKDQSRLQSFYRIANLFADVPHLKNKVKKREWLTKPFISRIPFERSATYDYLYQISFLRSGDYLGMYIRLVVIGGIFIWVIPNVWIKMLFAILFIYLSLFQMMALYQHHRTQMWLDLYPVNPNLKQTAVIKIIRKLGYVQAFAFTFLFIFQLEWLGSIIILAGALTFVWAYVRFYVIPKLSKV
ncbi:ABC transporter permease [Oceanobacillus jeddahense]|uniref:ABC transporter permease n=1 Tax=Oceanobacillus jeddahense TaxID=1462527 RepID=A0ABY5JXR6_9BACI|nr:ABC transporter permease [Oceanobacillus jeddahense]UUI05177.1 ABC transporter permease [Oceanobacillus jeddahense]